MKRRLSLLISSFVLLIGYTGLTTVYAVSLPDGIDQYIREPWLTETHNNSTYDGYINCVTSMPDGSNYVSAENQIIKYSSFGKNPTVIAGVAAGTTNNDADGVLATDAYFTYGLSCPVVGSDGTVYFIEHHYISTSDQQLDTIRVINPDGTLGTVAGNTSGLVTPGNDQQAKTASLTNISSLKFGPDGLLYIADRTNSGMIRRLNSNGTLTTIVGNNDPTTVSYEDGGPADQQNIDVGDGWPGIDFDTYGNLYTNGISKIYKITNDGNIHIIAGGGTDSTVEVKSISDSHFSYIKGLKVLPNGHILIFVTNKNAGSAPTFYDINFDDGTAYPFLNDVFSIFMGNDDRSMLSFTYSNTGDIYLGSYASIADYYKGPAELSAVTAHNSPDLNSPLFDETKWYSQPVTFYWQISDAHGGSYASGPINTYGEGIINQNTTYCEGAVCSSGSIQVKQDFTKPSGTINNSSALSSLGIQSSRSLTGTATDNLSGVDEITLIFTKGSQTTTLSSHTGGGIVLNCDSPSNTNCTWSATNPYGLLSSGSITLQVSDTAGNQNSESATQKFLNLSN